MSDIRILPAQLQLLATSGFDIPLTFYIGHETLRRELLQIHDFDQKNHRLAMQVDEKALQSLREQVCALNTLPSWEKTFADIFAAHSNKKKWILRPSLSTEDLVSRVFDNPTPAEMVRGVLEIVSSRYTSENWVRILATGKSPARCQFGVLVQEHISGEVSGVGFSRDPENLWHYIENPAELNGYTKWTQGRISPFSHAAPLALQPFWHRLVKGAKKTEQLLGFPCQFEWAFDGKKLWWLQVSPIASEDTQMLEKSRSGAKWSREKIAERFPSVMTPMGWSLIEETLNQSLQSLEDYIGVRCLNVGQASLFYRGYAYGNTKYFRYPNCRLKMSVAAKIMTRAIPIAAKAGLVWLTLFLRKRKRIKLAQVMKLHFFHAAALKAVCERVLGDYYTGIEDHVTKIKNFSVEEMAPIYSSGPLSQKLLANIQYLRSLSFAFFKTDLAIHFLKEAYVELIEKAFTSAGILGKASLLSYIRFEGNAALEMHQCFRQLTSALKEDSGTDLFLQTVANDTSPDFSKSLPALNETSRTHFCDFLSKCGHVTSGWDINSPCLREKGEVIASLIRRTLENKKSFCEPGSSFRSEVNLAEKCKDIPSAWAMSIERAVENARELCRADESQHFFAGLYIEQSRALLKKIALHLMSQGIIHAEDDIYYLNVDELEKSLRNPQCTFQYLVHERKKMWQKYGEERIPFNPPFSKGEEYAGEGRVIQGLGTSGGFATGTLYVADDWEDLSKLPANAILFTKTPNPSFVAWFDLCGAIITETGGMLSHGFIAARELRIPAVSGVSKELLTAGSRVSVNGDTGRVVIEQNR